LNIRVIIFFLLLPVVCFKAKAQSNGMDNAVSAGINIPVGDFSATHAIGIGVEYSPLRHIFQLYKWKRLAFTYNGGLAYYFGKKETVSGYPYDYPGYFFIHAFGGIVYNPFTDAGIALTGGPAVGIYDGHPRFTIGSKLELSFYTSKKITIGPGIIFMKESGADPLWAASLKATVAF
jgi:hypothetical protein